jgi:Outer membrane protein Omp28/Cleaved Adhesin Domain/Secretion system C-terminal sorting domain
MKKITLLLSLLGAFALNSQTYYSENFENPNSLNNWLSIDNDADPAPASGINYDEWHVDQFTQYFPQSNPIPIGMGSACSRSWADQIIYNPDNILISPAIDLTAVSPDGLMLSFNTGTIEGAPYSNEYYSVYVITTPDLASVLAATPIFSETLPDGASMYQRGFNIAAYAGQTVHFAFRHHNCTNMNTLLLDNVAVKTVGANNVSLDKIKLDRYSLVGSTNVLSVDVKNEGSNTINSVQVNWNDGTDHIQTISTSILPNQVVTLEHPSTLSYSSVTEKNITVSITQINGLQDSDPTNNTGTTNHNTVSQLSPKSVVFEEGTGTWCGWCPRGTVAMDYMTTTYPDNFIGIAVHNMDPMTVDEYNDGAAITSFPGVNVDRKLLGKPAAQSTFEQFYNERYNLVVPAKINGISSINGTTLTVDASATFRTNFTASNYRLAAIVVEDDVTGTTSDYDQHNYFAGGSNGAMGGFENLPDPVPAADMVYNHVGRALLGGYDGQSGSVPAAITDGQTVNYTFNYTIPSEFDANKLHVVVYLIDQTTGEIVNAGKADVTVGLENLENNIDLSIFPNPATTEASVSFVGDGSDYSLTLFDLQGREILSQQLKNVSGTHSVNLSVEDLAEGQYLISVATTTASFSKMISVKGSH